MLIILVKSSIFCAGGLRKRTDFCQGVLLVASNPSVISQGLRWQLLYSQGGNWGEPFSDFSINNPIILSETGLIDTFRGASERSVVG